MEETEMLSYFQTVPEKKGIFPIYKNCAAVVAPLCHFIDPIIK